MYNIIYIFEMRYPHLEYLDPQLNCKSRGHFPLWEKNMKNLDFYLVGKEEKRKKEINALLWNS